jgi:thioesterase domain-containing protein
VLAQAQILSGTTTAQGATGLSHRSDISLSSKRTLPDEPQRPTTETEGRLLKVWEEVFGIEGLGIEDDYFALGGTSLLAARLFILIAQNFNVKLPLSTIIEAPTVRALSHHLVKQGDPIFDWRAVSAVTRDPSQHPTRRMNSLVELKGGGSRKLFLVHDGDGETLLYRNMAQRLPADLSVIGIEPLGIPNVPLAQLSIEEMAAFYVGEMRRSQPSGPYLLGGLCAGGVIAFEMASQLVCAGEMVELVALLETAAPGAPKRAGLVTRRRLRRLTQALSDANRTSRSRVARAWTIFSVISRKLVNTLTWEIMQRGTRWSVVIRIRLLRYLRARGLPWPRLLPGLSVRQIYQSAEAAYLPKPLSHTCVLLARAQAGVALDIPNVDDTAYREIYADNTFGWHDLTDKLVVVDVDGGHSSMLQEPFVRSLATALMPFVDRRGSIRAPVVETEIA